MKQIDQTKPIIGKRLETNISEDQNNDGPTARFNNKHPDEENKFRDRDNEQVAKNLNFDQSNSSDIEKDIKALKLDN